MEKHFRSKHDDVTREDVYNHVDVLKDENGQVQFLKLSVREFFGVGGGVFFLLVISFASFSSFIKSYTVK